MYVKVKLRLKTGELTTVRAEIASDIKDYKKDTIYDVVSDWLDDNGVQYRWYRVENPDIYPMDK